MTVEGHLLFELYHHETSFLRCSWQTGCGKFGEDVLGVFGSDGDIDHLALKIRHARYREPTDLHVEYDRTDEA